MVALFWVLGFSVAIAQPTSVPALENWYQAARGKLGKNAQLGVMVAEADSGKVLLAKNANTNLSPASIVKLITTAAVLKKFTGSYTFPTEVFADRSSGPVGNIYIRGYGDPSMVSERMGELARLLYARGVRQANNVIVDDSLFLEPPPPTGTDPYKAGLSATSLNHNSYSVDVAPTNPGKAALVSVQPASLFSLSNKVQTAGGSTKQVSIAQNPASGAGVGAGVRSVQLTVSGKVGASSKPESIYQTVPSPSVYYGEYFKQLLQKAGVTVSGAVSIGKTPSAATLLQVYRSEQLGVIVRDLNHYSNNFIAGQLVYSLGQDSAGFFRLDKGLERLRGYLRELGIDEDSYQLYDGSGLDRRTKIAPVHFIKVLRTAYRDFGIQPEYIGSLSRFQLSGTLKRRSVPGVNTANPRNAKDLLGRGVWAKTGTLAGVSSLAGYARNSSGRTLVFVIIINGLQAPIAAKDAEEKLVSTLIGL